jgi:Sec-independent protein translocase protein TatE
MARYAACLLKKVSMGEISITKLLVVAALIILVFGTKKLRTLGGDLGSAIKGFKKAMNDDETTAKQSTEEAAPADKIAHKE